MNFEIENILLGILYFIIVVLVITLIWLISIPFWAEKKTVCKYWEERNGSMQCISKETIFCLKECD